MGIKNIFSKEEFNGVVKRDEYNQIVIDLSGMPSEPVKIITGSDDQLRAPCPEQTNLSSGAKPYVYKPAFQLGHVFQSAELPESKQHLENFLYFADSKDGQMHLVDTFVPYEWVHLKGIYSYFEKQANALNVDNPASNARLGTQEDWGRLLLSDHLFAANLASASKENGPSVYWKESGNSQPAGVVHLYMGGGFALNGIPPEMEERLVESDGEYTLDRNNYALGRIFMEEPKFEPVVPSTLGHE